MKVKHLLISLALGLGLSLVLVGALGIGNEPAVAAPVLSQVEAPATPAAELHVCPTGCAYSSIQDAVDAAGDGDVIKVATGSYTDVHVRPRNDVTTTGFVTQAVYISKTVAIQGGYTTGDWTTPDPDANPTTLDAQGQGRVIYITGDINPAIEGLRFTGGNAAGLGGQNLWDGTTHDAGGGVYAFTAVVTISKAEVFSNTAWTGGGLYVDGSATLTNSIIADNIAIGNEWESGGGGLYVSGYITLTCNTITGNKSQFNGGGLSLDWYSHATLTGNTISDNVIQNSSSGFQASVPLAPLSPERCGGGVFLQNGSHAVLTGTTISGNTAPERGGGVMIFYNDAVLNDNTITNNTTDGNGGGVYVLGDVTLSSNTISGNMSGWYGGGICLAGNGNALLFNNAIVDNQTNSNGSGVYMGGLAELFHTTIARNTGGNESGIYVDGGTVALKNTILVSQTRGINVTAGSTATLNGVLWYNNGANTGGAGTVIVTDEYIGTPAFATDGYHLTAGSNAIDKGVSTEVTDDIDGQLRPYNDVPDLGADEWYPYVAEYIHTISPIFKNDPCTSIYTITNQGTGTATMVHEFYDAGGQQVHVFTDTVDAGVSQGYDLAEITAIPPGSYGGYVVVTADQPFTYTLDPCPGCIPLASVEIAGPATGQTDIPYTFSAIISPAEATQPISYTWSPEPDSGQGTAGVNYAWPYPVAKIIRVTAENCSGLASATDKHVIRVGAVSTVDPGITTTVTYTGEQGYTTTLEFPPGAVNAPTTITYTPLITSVHPISVGLRIAGRAFDLDAHQFGQIAPDLIFLRPVTLTIHYSDDDVRVIDEETLALYRWFELLEQWRKVGDGLIPGEDQWLYPEDNLLVARLWRFSKFGSMGATHSIFLPVVLRNY